MAENIVTGGEAISRLLSRVNTDERIESINAEIKGAKGTNLSKLHRELKYLKALKENGTSAKDAYMLSKVPVLPPMYRPIYPDERGQLVVSSTNELLRDLGAVNQSVKDGADLPDEVRTDLESDLYQATSALFGLSNSISHKENKGIFEQIAGSNSPKGGYFQSKVISRRQNLSGRSTITVEPSLGLDEIGIPEEMAWTIYKPFAVRQLVSAGHSTSSALEEIKNRSTVALNAIEQSMAERPALINRAPSLHKFSVMSFIPKMVPGRDIKLNPLVLPGFNADFDGDQVAVHVPLGEKARKEAEGMFPSRHLFKQGTESIMPVPGQAAVLGLYRMTQTDGPVEGTYANEAEAYADYTKGKINLETRVTMGKDKTTLGRQLIKQFLPKGTEFGTMDKKEMERVLTDIGKNQPDKYGFVAQGLRDLGDTHATEVGFSMGLDDIEPMIKDRDRMVREAEAVVRASGHKPGTDKYNRALEKAYGDTAKKIESFALSSMIKNPLIQMVLSGSRGKSEQVRQILAAPLLVSDAQERTIPIPIIHSYVEGLDPQEYWAASHGVRKGMIGRSQQTAKPGALAKELLASIVDGVITKDPDDEDFEPESIDLSVDRSDDLVDRFASKTIKDKKGRIIVEKKQLLTTDMIGRMKKSGIKEMSVYTPMNSEVPGGGITALSFGLNERGQLPEIGDNMGLLSGHAITEPMSQMTMKAFHSGGVAGVSNIPDGFARVDQLLRMPDKVLGKATLSEVDGTVDKIEKSPAGGHFVFVSGSKHFVPADRALTVKEKQKIGKGDILSDGVVKPQELLALKGLKATQNYLVDELQGAMPGVRRRYLETVVGAMTNVAEVEDAGDSADLSPGDQIPMWRVNDFNRRAKREGLQQVKANAVLKGVNVMPIIKARTSQNWLAGMDYRRLKDVLQEATLQNHKAEIHSFNPISAYAYGAEFGMGEHGKY